MPEPLTPAAPAPPVQPEPTISATRDAANRGDFNAFEKADSAARSGKALPDVAATPEPAAAAPAAPVAVAPAAAEPAKPGDVTPAADRQLSKRQQEANDRTREAVDRATSDLQAENARLRAQLGTAGQPAPAAPAPRVTPDAADPRPNAEDATKYPAGQYEPQFVEDLAAWKTRQVLRENDAQAQARAAQDQHVRSIEERDRTFSTHIADAKKTDPDVMATIHADVIALRPRDALREGEQAGPLNDVAECILKSDMPVTVMKHLSEHPDVLQRLAGLQKRSDVLYEMGLLHGQLTSASTSAPAQPAAASPSQKLISDAPPPAPIISTPHASADPKAAAIARGDFAAFDKIDMQERKAQRAGVS